MSVDVAHSLRRTHSCIWEASMCLCLWLSCCSWCPWWLSSGHHAGHDGWTPCSGRNPVQIIRDVQVGLFFLSLPMCYSHGLVVFIVAWICPNVEFRRLVYRLRLLCDYRIYRQGYKDEKKCGQDSSTLSSSWKTEAEWLCYSNPEPFHSWEWSMSNFSCSLSLNITSHRMENLAFHSLLRWEIIIRPILTTSLIHRLLKLLGECTF